MGTRICCLAWGLATAICVATPALARELSFAERVDAQRAIDRVYYSHQTGAMVPFEDAVPQRVLEDKVDSYLRQSAALEEVWNTPVTAEMLNREMARIVRDSRMPERLHELFTALNHDAVLLQECLARPILVDRLSRNFFAFDHRFHADSLKAAEELRRELVRGELDVGAEHPWRTVLTYDHTRSAEAQTEEIELGQDEFDQENEHAGCALRPLGETRDAFAQRVLLEVTPERTDVAVYSVPKRTWDDWWRGVSGNFDPTVVETVAHPGVAIDSPNLLEVPCSPDHTWELDELPEGRSNHTAVWTGSLMLVWGGQSEGYPVAGGMYDPATDSWSGMTVQGAPVPRASHTAVWTGSAMIVWGGFAGSTFFNNGARYDPFSDTWTPISGSGAPTTRYQHAAVWTGTEMIVWGGQSQFGGSSLNTGGRYDPVHDSWSPTTLAGAPSARYDHKSVWTGSVMIVWGGYDGNYTNTGGLYDPVADEWASTSTDQSPSGRTSHSLVWTGSHAIVWGGSGANGVVATGASYDPEFDSWEPLSDASSPSARSGHTAVWAGSRMLVWGGGTNLGGRTNTGGSYVPETDTWQHLPTAGAPGPRFSHTAVWTGSLMIVWGGTEGTSQKVNTGGRFDPATGMWTPTSTGTAPSPRALHVAGWTGSLMIVWGGTGPGIGNTGGRYDPATDSWSATSTTNAPSTRHEHTAVWTGSKMIVWGGTTLGSVNTGGRYDPIADNWTPTTTVGAPSARRVHTAVWTGSRMIVWGGVDGSNTGGVYDPVADSWTPTSVTNAPSARDSHSAVWAGSRMIVWGGSSLSAFLSTGGLYDPATDQWTPTSTLGAPTARYRHTAVWTGSDMIVWGGRTTLPLGAGRRYDPNTDSWALISVTGEPTPRAQHTAVWTGSRMIVWGGYGSNYLGSGGVYEPTSDSWMSTSATGAPSARYLHSAIWTGRRMIVWGGAVSSSWFNVGGQYAVGDTDDGDGDGFTECAGDCNDADAAVAPSAVELCNASDDNCNSLVDEDELGVDSDLDGVAGACDNCPEYANPEQGPVLFGQDVLATSPDTFAWTTSADVRYVRGGLAGVSGYAVDESGALVDATALTSGNVPAAGAGFYYLVRLGGSCTAGSWQTVLGAEPGRDASLP